LRLKRNEDGNKKWKYENGRLRERSVGHEEAKMHEKNKPEARRFCDALRLFEANSLLV